MYLLSNLQTKSTVYFNILLAVIPISFIAGNMIININILLLILSTFLIFKKETFTIEFKLIDKLIFLFFLLILTSSALSDYYFYSKGLFHETKHGLGYLTTTVKSILFFKYLFLYLVVRFLVEKNHISLEKFFISCAVCSLFVSFDIFYQFIFGTDIFGFGIVEGSRKLGGPFGDELIAGSFIQRFSLFTFFLLPIYFGEKKINKYLKFLLPIIFMVFSAAIILAGNRMPLVLFIFTFFLIFLFQKEVRKFFFHFIIIFVLIFTILININSNIKNNFKNFYMSISSMVTVYFNEKQDTKALSHLQEYSTFYDTWLMHKYVGGGIKNYRYFCHVRPNAEKNDQAVCNMHPHNYYLEILTETGLAGFLIVSAIMLLTLYDTFFKKYIFKNSLLDNKIIIPFIFLFCAEIFPIKSTGSFFTTGNTTYIFLILAILIALSRKENLIEKKI